MDASNKENCWKRLLIILHKKNNTRSKNKNKKYNDIIKEKFSKIMPSSHFLLSNIWYYYHFMYPKAKWIFIKIHFIFQLV